MPLLLNHFWILFIIFTIVNGLIWKSKSKKYIAENPELREGYDSLIKGWFIYANIPWIIIGIGMLSGMTNDLFEFFNPRQTNPIVIIFFAVIIIEWALSNYWIFFKGGAEKLVKHPGMFTHAEKGNEKFETMKIKLLCIVGTIGGIIGIVMMWKMNIPVDTFGQ